MNLLFVLGDDRYMYGINQCSPGPIHGVWALHNRKHPDKLDWPWRSLKIEYSCFIAHAILLTTLRIRAISFSETSASTYLSILMIQEIPERK
jgi:predicted RNA-binding protein with PUA-like domain